MDIPSFYYLETFMVEQALYPSFTKVCKYISFEDFKKQRVESSQWVHFKQNVDKILEGKYFDVMPLHVELSPTYSCNFSCSWCNHTATKKNTVESNFEIDFSSLERIINQFSLLDIGIQWTGGEPLLAKSLLNAIEYASNLNVKQCLFTNGSLLDDSNIARLLKTNLSFVRISLNCVTPNIHSKYHGLKSERYSLCVPSNIQNLLQKKIDFKSEVEIGVSIVVNDDNINDLCTTLLFLIDCIQLFPKSLDYIVIRSVFNFRNGNDENGNDLFHELRNSKEINFLIEKIIDFGIRVVEPYNYDKTVCNVNHGCLSSNWFLEIKSNGDVLNCSDVYGNVNYKIGNIKQMDIIPILNSNAKKLLGNNLLESKCFQTICPKNGRGFMLNNLFYQIENYRKENKLDEVKKWIQAIRDIIPKPKHSFFI